MIINHPSSVSRQKSYQFFAHCVPEFEEGSLLLVKICSRWRDIPNTTAHLWREIHFVCDGCTAAGVVAALKMWLLGSATLPLRLISLPAVVLAIQGKLPFIQLSAHLRPKPIVESASVLLYRRPCSMTSAACNSYCRCCSKPVSSSIIMPLYRYLHSPSSSLLPNSAECISRTNGKPHSNSFCYS